MGSFLPLILLAFLEASAGAADTGDHEPADLGLVEEVVVSSDLARDRETPAAFTTLEAADLAPRLKGQDMGMLLGDTPNAYAYSDAGNGVGYSYLGIRGFDQRRVAVNINGVPLNTPEGRQVYYIDLADFAASAERVQVQRGAGTALYGSPAVGGVVQIDLGNLSLVPGGEAALGVGSFGTYRASFRYGGPLADGRWAWMVRAAHVGSDGYRDPSWTRHSLLHVAFQRYAESSLWRIHVFGGPERTQLAYYGVPASFLDDDALRRTNVLRDGETDTFVQPQIQVIHDRKVGDRVFLKNIWYAILGDGYYRQYSSALDYDPFGPEAPPPGYEERTVLDAWRKRSIENRQVGWIPRVTWSHRGGSLTAGAEILLHAGRHFGSVEEGAVCLDASCDATEPVGDALRLYDFTNRKVTYSLFARETLRPRPDLAVNLEVQATRHEYAMRDDRVRGLSWDATYSFVTPRAGLNWNVSDQWNLWAQVSTGRTEPYFTNVWNPEDPFANPASSFREFDDALDRYSDPVARPERLTAVEAGFGWASGPHRAKVHLYRMDFRDEFVYAGGLDDDGVPITENAAHSVHRGVEIDGTTRLPGGVDLSGSLAWSFDELVEHTVFVPQDDGTVVGIDSSGNRVALFPESLIRLRAARVFGPARIELGFRRVGTIWLDNTENERKNPAAREQDGWVDKAIDPYAVWDLGARIDLSRFAGGGGRTLRLDLMVDNLLDARYETMGYAYPDATSATGSSVEFFPAATRGVWAGVTFGF